MVSCTPVTTSYFATPSFLLLSLHSVTAISIPIHGFALYCVLFKTPDQMKSVKWYLVNLHIWIVLYDYSVCLLTVPMLLLPTMAGYTLGILKELGIPNIIQTTMVFLWLIYVLLSILAIFENRFHTVCNFNWKSYWSSVRFGWLGLHYLTGFAILIPFLFMFPDQNIAKKRIFEKLPCLPDYIYQADVFVTADDYTYHMTVLVTFLVFGTLEGATFIFLLVINTIGQLRAKKMSQKLFEIQKKFFIALVVQMTVPLIFLLIPLSYAVFSILYNHHDQALTNIGVTMESSHGLASSLVMIFIHRPYREAFFGMISRMPSTGEKTSQRNNLSNNRVVPLRTTFNKV